MNILQDLEFRELIYQVTDADELQQRLAAGPITLYIGFDPTADSLHVGHLLPVIGLRRFQKAGHLPIALVGGGTGLIGDPSGKVSERALGPADQIEEWTGSIRKQLKRYLDFDAKTNPARLENNYRWLGELEVINFLREIGKHFSLGSMLAKESVRSRLSAGISYTEFSYMILQSYDFLKLNELYNCELQAGGSDQWGNITTGIDLIRRVTNRKAYGLTFPLITKSDGTKFGKTEGEAVWLDPARTSPYQFYQFWFNTDDRDVIKFIKFFTFLSHAEILNLQEEVENNPGKRVAQRTLAREVTALVHDQKAVTKSEKIAQTLFYGDLQSLTAAEIEEAFQGIPSLTSSAKEYGLVDLLVKSGLSSSRRQAREDIKNRSIRINNIPETNIHKVLRLEDRLCGKYTLLLRGKKNHFLVKWLT
ncbi:MAG: tyrosine--tRNA ligase [Firmicutes bacterium]|nr:tyrosine--tRNA ligase [Bacillota bacterium]